MLMFFVKLTLLINCQKWKSIPLYFLLLNVNTLKRISKNLYGFLFTNQNKLNNQVFNLLINQKDLVHNKTFTLKNPIMIRMQMKMLLYNSKVYLQSIHKSPPRLLNKYKSNNVKTLLSKKNQNRLYESLANVCLTSTPNEKIQHPRSNKLPIRHLKQMTQQDEEEIEIIKKIPCAFINNQSKQTLVYFHSNGEDLYQAYELMWRIGNSLKLNILGVEYPGYGIYKGDPNEQTILEDADHIMNYLINTKKIEESNIMICGRSIGSGPACYIASKYKPFMLILISPFLSIQQLVENKLGKLFSVLIKERFPNYKHISEVQCPIYILHGQSDNMIPISHALKLQRLCRCKCKLTTPYHMTHATFNLQQDLIIPLLRFMMS